MNKTQLQKLARLASGAAVLSLGPLGPIGTLAATSCKPSSAPTDSNPPHTINSPPTTTDTPTGAGDLAEAGMRLRPGVNAPVYDVPDPSGGPVDASATVDGAPRIPRHGNAMPPGSGDQP